MRGLNLEIGVHRGCLHPVSEELPFSLGYCGLPVRSLVVQANRGDSNPNSAGLSHSRRANGVEGAGE